MHAARIILDAVYAVWSRQHQGVAEAAACEGAVNPIPPMARTYEAPATERRAQE